MPPLANNFSYTIDQEIYKIKFHYNDGIVTKDNIGHLLPI